MQDPERYLKERKVTPPSIFPNGKRPLVDSSLRERVNYEIYYFATAAEKERFKKDRLRSVSYTHLTLPTTSRV